MQLRQSLYHGVQLICWTIASIQLSAEEQGTRSVGVAEYRRRPVLRQELKDKEGTRSSLQNLSRGSCVPVEVEAVLECSIFNFEHTEMER